MSKRRCNTESTQPSATPHETPGRICVIGVGNDFREDDAAGLLAARLLREVVPEKVAVLEKSGEGGALMAAWEGAQCVFLCDAVSSSGAPGTVVRIDANRESVPQGIRPCSSHAFGVAEAIEMARMLGTLPPRLIVFGIVGRRFGGGVEVSAEAEAGVAEAVRRVREEIGGLGA